MVPSSPGTRTRTTGIPNSGLVRSTTITCWGEGFGIKHHYTGNIYDSIHGPDGLPSAFIDGHATWVEREHLVYDGRDGAEILRAVRSPIIGQSENYHPESKPLE